MTDDKATPAATIRGLRIPEPQAMTPLAAALEDARLQRDRADAWFAVVAAIEKVLDDHAFDDEDGNGFVPIGPLEDALFGKKVPA